jgi:hypothetical protein
MPPLAPAASPDAPQRMASGVPMSPSAFSLASPSPTINDNETDSKGHTRHIVCVIFVAGHGSRLESELEHATSSDLGNLASFANVPKALLPASSDADAKPMLTLWWELLREGQIFHEVYLVSNADKYKFFERWATANNFPVGNIINDGTTTSSARLGSLGDFDLARRPRRAWYARVCFR